MGWRGTLGASANRTNLVLLTRPRGAKETSNVWSLTLDTLSGLVGVISSLVALAIAIRGELRASRKEKRSVKPRRRSHKD